MNKYKSPYALWCEKNRTRFMRNQDNERMRLGRDLEDYIAGRFTEVTGLKTKKTNYSYQSDKYPFMLANIDRWVTGAKDVNGNHKRIGLEIKTMSDFAAKTTALKKESFLIRITPSATTIWLSPKQMDGTLRS